MNVLVGEGGDKNEGSCQCPWRIRRWRRMIEIEEKVEEGEVPDYVVKSKEIYQHTDYFQ